MIGSSLKRIPGSTWLRVTLTTAALGAVAVLSSGCVMGVTGIVGYVPM